MVDFDKKNYLRQQAIIIESLSISAETYDRCLHGNAQVLGAGDYYDANATCSRLGGRVLTLRTQVHWDVIKTMYIQLSFCVKLGE